MIPGLSYNGDCLARRYDWTVNDRTEMSDLYLNQAVRAEEEGRHIDSRRLFRRAEEAERQEVARDYLRQVHRRD